MRYLLNEFGLYAQRLFGTLVGLQQFMVGGIQLAIGFVEFTEGLSALHGIDMEEDEDDGHEDSHRYQALLR